MIKRDLFKASDLIKMECPSIDTTMTYFVCHIVRAGGNKEKLEILREALMEIDNFITEVLLDQNQGLKVN